MHLEITYVLRDTPRAIMVAFEGHDPYFVRRWIPKSVIVAGQLPLALGPQSGLLLEVQHWFGAMITEELWRLGMRGTRA